MPQFNQNKLKKLKKIDKLLSFLLPSRTLKNRYIANVNNKEIIIIAFFLIGDTVMYLPALRVIRKNFPNSKITLICTKVVEIVLKEQNLVDQFIIVDCPWIAPFNKSLKNIFSFFKKIHIINKSKYDICIDFRGDWRNIFYMNFINSKNKVSFNASGGEYMLTHPIECNVNISHYTDEGIYLLQQLGLKITDENKFPKLLLNDKDKLLINTYIKECGFENKFIIGLHPGVSASADARKWDDNKFVEFINSLHQFDENIVFLLYEGPNEKETIINICEKLNKNIQYVVVKKTLSQYIKLLNASNLLICNDSGAGHLAAAYNIPVLVIFGKADPQAVKPLGNNVSIISHELDCKPCNQHICPLGTNECIKNITVDEVLDEVKKILNSATISK